MIMKLVAYRPEIWSPPDAKCVECRGMCCRFQPGIVHPMQLGSTATEIANSLEHALTSGALRTWVWMGDWTSADGKLSAWCPWVVTAPHMLGVGCAYLGPNGCELPREHRPLQCLALRPDDPGRTGCVPHPDTTKAALIEAWLPFQEVLS